MKTQYLFPAVMPIIIFVLISCTNAESTSLGKPEVANEKKAKKRTIVTKREKKTFTLIKKKKHQPLSVSNPQKEKETKKEIAAPRPDMALMNVFAKQVKNYAMQNNYSTKFCFLLDMSLPSGSNRFFVYDLEKSSVVYAALVAHGSCNETFRSQPKFSNAANSGCTSLGKYKVGELYYGKYGKSYRLYGLDNSNSSAYKRGVVIHAYKCVPDKEIYPSVLCNSFGCPMVSHTFFGKLSQIIAKSDKPIVLWIYS